MFAASEAVALASTFRVRYASGVDAEEAAAQFQAIDGVEYAEPNRYRETYQVVPNDPSFAAQWGLTRIRCPQAWTRGTGSADITVAVVDTGVDLDHPELASLLVAGQDMVDLGTAPVAPPGFRFEGDFNGRDNDPQDEVGHGTHVAGTIACLSNNSVGVAGVTWACRVMPVRVLARIVNISNPSDVRGVGSAADIAAGIRWAADHGARVINLSLGGTTDTRVERDAIAYAISRNVVVVAAMGNLFNQGNPTSFPAAYPDVIAVGAIDQANNRATFSQTGAHIDIAGPGVGILSTVWDNGYATYNGTSMARPTSRAWPHWSCHATRPSPRSRSATSCARLRSHCATIPPTQSRTITMGLAASMPRLPSTAPARGERVSTAGLAGHWASDLDVCQRERVRVAAIDGAKAVNNPATSSPRPVTGHDIILGILYGRR
jgi:subtilisin family serine protease